MNIGKLRSDLIRQKNQNLILQTEHLKEAQALKQKIEVCEQKVVDYEKKNRELRFINAELKHENDQVVEKYQYSQEMLELANDEVVKLKRKLQKGSSSPECFVEASSPMFVKSLSERSMSLFLDNDRQLKQFKGYSFSGKPSAKLELWIPPQKKEEEEGDDQGKLNKGKEVVQNFEKIRLSMSSMKRSLYRSVSRMRIFQLEVLDEFRSLRIHEQVDQQQREYEKRIQDLENELKKREEFYQKQISNIIEFFHLNSMYSKVGS